MDLAVPHDREVTAAEINSHSSQLAAEEALSAGPRYTTDPVVSTDIIGDFAS